RQRFLFTALAARLVASLAASLASPMAFWPLPFTSWTAPSPCRRSEPVASPTPCLALPMASLAVPLILSVVPLMKLLLFHLLRQRYLREFVPELSGFDVGISVASP